MLWALGEEWEHLPAQVLVCTALWGARGVPGAALCTRDSSSTHRKASSKLKWTWDRLLLFLMPQPGVMPFLASWECPIETCSVNPLQLGCFSFHSLFTAGISALEQPVVTRGVLGGWAVMWGLCWVFLCFVFIWHVEFTCHLQTVLVENNFLASKEIDKEFPSSVMHSMTGKPDGFVALDCVSVLSGNNVPIASVFWTPGRLWGIESALELPCAWSDLQQKTGMEELIWRWVCIAWKSAAVCLSKTGCG